MKKKLRRLLLLILPALLALVVVAPVAFLLAGAFMDQRELRENLGPVLLDQRGRYASWSFLPRLPTLRPAAELLLDSPAFFPMFWNTLWTTGGILLGQMAVGAPAAWGFARYRFPLGRGLFMVYVVLMLMPFQVTMLSSFIALNRLGLMDTRWAVILPGAFSTFPVYIMYRFFRSIPEAVLESARLDAQNGFQVFWYIGLPLGSAGLVSAAVLGFLESWNLVEQPLAFLRDKTLWPLSLYLPNISLQQAGPAFAASVVALVPALLVFLSGQDYLEQGIVAAAVKG